MSWFSNIFSSTVGTVIDSVGNAIDKLVTSDAEKLQLHNELAKIQVEAELIIEHELINNQAEVLAQAKALPALEKWLAGQQIIKEIYQF